MNHCARFHHPCARFMQIWYYATLHVQLALFTNSASMKKMCRSIDVLVWGKKKDFLKKTASLTKKKGAKPNKKKKEK